MNPIYRIIETTRDYFQSDTEKSLVVKIAENSRERKAAQKLRKEVFAADLPAGSLALDDADEDEFDEHCRHLIVIDQANSKVVGTYRVLHASTASYLGRYYSEDAFDLTKLQEARSSLIELGRSFVHPNYRTAGVLRLLWSGLADILERSPERFVIGSPSVSSADGGHYAASIHRKLSRKHLCTSGLRVMPRVPLRHETLFANCDPVIPPVFKGYLRAGANLMGEPHSDEKLGTVNFFMMLPVAAVLDRHPKNFKERQRSIFAPELHPAQGHV